MVYPYLRCLLDKDDKYSIKIKDVSVKENLVCQLLTMSESRAREIDNCIAARFEGKRRHIASPGYMLDLYKQIQRTIEIDLIADIFLDFEPWREERNQLIHALLSKTVISSELAKKECVQNGCSLARNFDNCLVKPFKKGNSLRKKYRIQ